MHAGREKYSRAAIFIGSRPRPFVKSHTHTHEAQDKKRISSISPRRHSLAAGAQLSRCSPRRREIESKAHYERERAGKKARPEAEMEKAEYKKRERERGTRIVPSAVIEIRQHYMGA